MEEKLVAAFAALERLAESAGDAKLSEFLRSTSLHGSDFLSKVDRVHEQLDSSGPVRKSRSASKEKDGE